MPKTLFRDNYYYELYSQYLTIYKYDIFDQQYIKVDQCYLMKIPPKYMDIIEEFSREENVSLTNSFMNIKITA